MLIEPGSEAKEIGPSAGLEGVPPMMSRAVAMAALDGRPDVEAAASELDAARAGADALGRVTGRVDVEQLLDVIFRDFCIGK